MSNYIKKPLSRNQKLEIGHQLLKEGYTYPVIADNTGFSLSDVEAMATAYGLKQQKQEFFASVKSQLENNVPILLDGVLTELTRLIKNPGTNTRDKLKAIELASSFLEQLK